MGALASAAMAWRSSDYGYYQRLMAAAAKVYATSLRSIARSAPHRPTACTFLKPCYCLRPMRIDSLPRFHIKECRYLRECSVMALNPPYDVKGKYVLVVYIFSTGLAISAATAATSRCYSRRTCTKDTSGRHCGPCSHPCSRAMH